jgi:tRNA-binding EMAP/Myf-like protein
VTGSAHARRGPIAGRVESVQSIPNSDWVRLARIDVGSGRYLNIVFGGDRSITPGDMVPVAPPGSWVPGPQGIRTQMVKMRPRNFRGQRSEGMLCSLLELGWARTRGRQDAPESRRQVAVLTSALEPGEALPGPQDWRSVVAHPNPDDFDPNTVELSVEEIAAALGVEGSDAQPADAPELHVESLASTNTDESCATSTRTEAFSPEPVESTALDPSYTQALSPV